jgi:hypothetical protein
VIGWSTVEEGWVVLSMAGDVDDVEVVDGG